MRNALRVVLALTLAWLAGCGLLSGVNDFHVGSADGGTQEPSEVGPNLDASATDSTVTTDSSLSQDSTTPFQDSSTPTGDSSTSPQDTGLASADQSAPDTSPHDTGAPDACGGSCTPTSNACDLGTLICLNGATPVCKDTGNPNTGANGSACGQAGICTDGACAPCTPGAACTPSNPCLTGTVACGAIGATCVPGSSVTDLTTCGSGAVCCGGQCDPCAAPRGGSFLCGGTACTAVCPGLETTCGGVCTDMGTDPANCGRCGHGCCGGTCQAGVCQPLVLAASLDAPFGITVDSTNVYWTSGGGNIVALALDGGAMTTLASNQHGTDQIAVDQTSAYWTDQSLGAGSVMKVPLTGAPLPTALVMNVDAPTGIAVDSANVYFTVPATGAVMMVPIDGGTATALASGQTSADRITVSAGTLYWTNRATAGSVNSLTLDGGTATVLTTADTPRYLAVLGPVVYFGEAIAAAGTVNSVPVTGGTATALATAQGTPQGVATDGTSIYWADSTGGTVMAATLDGGTPTTLATGQSTPTGIAIDSTCVYFTDDIATTGSVVVVAKP